MSILIMYLNAYGSFNVRMGVVSLKLEVFEVKVKDVFLLGIEMHCGQWPRVAREL